MKRVALTVVVALAVVSFACQQAGPISEQDRAAIQKAHDGYAAAIGKKPAAELVKLYFADQAKVAPPNYPAIQDRDQMAKLFSRPAKAFKFDQLEVDGRGDLACVYGLWEADWLLTNGTTEHDKGKFLETWKRQADGAWKALHSTWNSDLPAGFTIATGEVKAEASAELKNLAWFVGRWEVEVDAKASPLGPAGKLILTNDCRWFPGGLAVVCYSTGAVPGGALYHDISILGYDAGTKTYVGSDLDNQGGLTPVTAAFKDGLWTMTGETRAGGKVTKLRSAMTAMTNDGYAGKAEFSTGGAWTLMSEAKAKRIGQ